MHVTSTIASVLGSYTTSNANVELLCARKTCYSTLLSLVVLLKGMGIKRTQND